MTAPKVLLNTPENITKTYEHYRTPPDRERTLDVYEKMGKLWVPRQTWEEGTLDAVEEITHSEDVAMVIKPHDSNFNPFQDASAGWYNPVLHALIGQRGVHIIAKENWYKYPPIHELFDAANAIPASRQSDDYLRRVAAKELMKVCVGRMVEFGECAWNYPTGHRNKVNPSIVPDKIRPGIVDIIRAVQDGGRTIHLLPAASWAGNGLRRKTTGNFRPSMTFGMPFLPPKDDEELVKAMVDSMQIQLNLAIDRF